ncbi:glycine-rich domain-containing protein [Mucilaginibacter ginsenosidivorax]|uniref:Glycine-rich domain-containing protein-like n=1 Tax=Mucilaginibacter ginsenosidivorax TaxID=862126 RepID=A0A5B8W5B8_9SPHI|nr:hypothetical protein [Mucilaginibacter ginsenosidivorax]QEC78963.1 hypothetical protein FSB76_24555 [Mucilaginibacter ginsenosidivorax]
MINKIAALNLSAIGKKITAAGKAEIAIETAEQEYKRFLTMVAVFPGERIVPNIPADWFWHEHILDTRRYMADTTGIFGNFLHHQPVYETSNEINQTIKAAEKRSEELYRYLFKTEMQFAFADCSDGNEGSCWAVSAEE